MSLFETFLTLDDLTEGRGFPQSFHVNARILHTLLFSRFPTNPHSFSFYQHKHPNIYYIHRILILSGLWPWALYVVSLTARSALQPHPTPAHARVVDESLHASAVSSPNERPHCRPSVAYPGIFFREGGFNKFSWGQRADRTGIWGR